MQKIIPHLWFDKEAAEAAKLYTSVFPASKVRSTATIEDTPSGTVETVAINLSGCDFYLLSAGPLFKFTPAISFVVGCETKDEVDSLWARLREGGMELMPLDAYPFGERYAWIQDRYGLSWQLLYSGGKRVAQKITPALMFVGAQCGKAGEAIRFYTSVFRNAQVDEIIRYGPQEEPDKPGSIKQAAFSLEGQRFTAMDSAYDHAFSFNEAISLMVYCENQAELDYYWGRLSAFPEDEQCGWLKDKFGVSWQVVPTLMDELTREKESAKRRRFTEAMLKMKKLDIAELQRTQL